MLSKFPWDVFIPCLLIFTLFSGAFIAFESAYPKPENVSYYANSKQDTNYERTDTGTTAEKQIAKYTYWLTVFTAVLGVATIGLIGIGVLQYRELNRTVKLAREEFIVSHRPQILVRRVVLSDTNEVIFSITNTGANEAKNIMVSARLWLPNGNLPAIPPYSDPIREADTLNAGDTNTFRREIDRKILAEHEFKTGFYQVSRGRQNTGPAAQEPSLLFLGYVDYADALGRKRKPGFLRQYDMETGRFNPIPHAEFEYQD